MRTYDCLVIGGGPAGLAAAIAAHKNGAHTLLVEREARLGGILKQCIHDGFGLVRFQEKLSGPEYAERFMDMFRAENIEALTLTFVTRIQKTDNGFAVTLVNRDGVETVESKTLILATGCRERTAKQIQIHGTRPSGVFTAGTAQHFTNLLGELPTKRCVILGSGDIGLIMARRLTLEGAEVVGVYEAKSTPSGLTRNIHQCLHDYNIPLYLSHTVTRVFGQDRLTAVEIAQVDEKMQPIAGTEQVVECDALILSVGLIPENELAENLGVQLDPKTKGPVCNAQLMTTVDGVFSCGNALHVNDLVDYVSESGEIAGENAAKYAKR
ncbi:MAG: NAD(P)/FAD-dependent oxidoreductase, partial [Candidatus Fimenecus sp.]